MSAFTKKISIVAIIIFSAGLVHAQHIEMVTTNHDCSLRGLSAVSERTIWVSGSNGTVGLSLDGGGSWKWMTVTHFEKMDFRDIEAFSDQEAVIMGITLPAVILKTTDGGNSWRTVFRDTSSGMFLDAMDFSGDTGMVIGDPINKKIFLARSVNRGDEWETFTEKSAVTAEAGEAFFASSGGNICLTPHSGQYAFVSGGTKANIYIDSNTAEPLQLQQGKESTGANAIATDPANSNRAVVVGGDFKNDKDTTLTCTLLTMRPFSQASPSVSPHGYRSSVAYLTSSVLLACGTSGVDISTDGGHNWKLISPESFHVCGRSKTGNRIFLAGSKGKVAVLNVP